MTARVFSRVHVVEGHNAGDATEGAGAEGAAEGCWDAENTGMTAYNPVTDVAYRTLCFPPGFFSQPGTPRQIEMEYFIPELVALKAAAQFVAIAREIAGELQPPISIMGRYVGPDNIALSPAFEQQSVALTLICKHATPGGTSDDDMAIFAKFGDVFESICLEFNGRPHWGKRHSLRADDLAAKYTDFPQYCAIREKHDPHGIFLNEYLERLLVPQ